MSKKWRGSKWLPAVMLAFLLLALPVSAEIRVETDKGVYNFGDSIVASYEFSRDQDFSGLMKLSLYCSGFELEFYTLPTNIYAGERQQVTVPPLSVSPAMLGKCYVAANATSYDRLINESSTSNFFNVTSLISVAVEVAYQSYLPGSIVEVSGRVGKSHSLPASAVMEFLGTNYASPVTDNVFAYSVKLPKNIKSGNHSLSFLVNDSYGNSGSASAQFSVEAVPTRLVNFLDKQVVRPSESFSVTVSAYDQADDALSGEVGVSVTDSSGIVVMIGSGITGSNMILAFQSHQKPGSYTLSSSALGLSAASQVVVEEVEDASVSLGSNTVVLKNTGNVNYVRQFNITLSGERSYVVVQDVDLAPGEAFEVDLSSAVREGTYNVAFPTVANSSVVENAFIEDNRPLLKKTSDFLGITGRAVTKLESGTGKVQAKFAPLLLFLIVAVTAFYFVKNRRRGGGKGNDFNSDNFGSGSGGGSDTAVSSAKAPSPPVQSSVPSEEDRVRQIIEEKRRQIQERYPQQPKSLRDDPAAQKFVRDMMKEKKFR
ncbi:hypothetical protein HYU18_03240 [Candidatus Woesearchaeota archaeon]|nr:hypothetical protein [Candidatus Woesearchaeota archaeon]